MLSYTWCFSAETCQRRKFSHIPLPSTFRPLPHVGLPLQQLHPDLAAPQTLLGGPIPWCPFSFCPGSIRFTVFPPMLGFLPKSYVLSKLFSIENSNSAPHPGQGWKPGLLYFVPVLPSSDTLFMQTVHLPSQESNSLMAEPCPLLPNSWGCSILVIKSRNIITTNRNEKRGFVGYSVHLGTFSSFLIIVP